jgi:hypothetical protein
VATPAERARLYFRFRQSRVLLAADPDLITHRAYGLPSAPMSAEIGQAVEASALAFAREHGLAAQPGTAFADVNAIDGYQPTADDQTDFARHRAQFIGQFLLDRDGIVRWVNVERVPGEFPSEVDLLAAVRKDR